MAWLDYWSLLEIFFDFLMKLIGWTFDARWVLRNSWWEFNRPKTGSLVNAKVDERQEMCLLLLFLHHENVQNHWGKDKNQTHSLVRCETSRWSNAYYQLHALGRWMSQDNKIYYRTMSNETPIKSSVCSWSSLIFLWFSWGFVSKS